MNRLPKCCKIFCTFSVIKNLFETSKWKLHDFGQMRWCMKTDFWLSDWMVLINKVLMFFPTCPFSSCENQYLQLQFRSKFVWDCSWKFSRLLTEVLQVPFSCLEHRSPILMIVQRNNFFGDRSCWLFDKYQLFASCKIFAHISLWVIQYVWTAFAIWIENSRFHFLVGTGVSTLMPCSQVKLISGKLLDVLLTKIS